MVIVKMKCGLGNQMFQYAIGRRISVETGEDLKFDMSWFGNYNEKDIPRDLSIDKYAVSLPLATEMEIAKSKPSRFCELIEKAKGKYFLNYHYRFHPSLLKKKNAYLDGYFQSYRYFEPIRNIILSEFVMKDGYSDVGMMTSKIISDGGESVALHVRRGDYATVREGYNGLCSIEYYAEAVRRIKEGEGGIKIFVFSDDIEWAKANLDFGVPMEFVSRPGLGDAEELILMSLCKHQIIANSSYSWWAAWLNRNPEKIVVAPRRWLAATDIDTRDLIPEEWIRL